MHVGATIFLWQQPLDQPSGTNANLVEAPYCHQLEAPGTVLATAAALRADGVIELATIAEGGRVRYWDDHRMPGNFVEGDLALQGDEAPRAMARLSFGDFAVGLNTGAVLRIKSDAIATVVTATRLSLGSSWLRRCMSLITAQAPAEDPVRTLIALPKPGDARAIALVAMTGTKLRVWFLPSGYRYEPAEAAGTLILEENLEQRLKAAWRMPETPELRLLKYCGGGAGLGGHFVVLTTVKRGTTTATETQLCSLLVRPLVPEADANAWREQQQRQRQQRGAPPAPAERERDLELSESLPLTLGNLNSADPLYLSGLSIEPHAPAPPADEDSAAPLPESVTVHVACGTSDSRFTNDLSEGVVVVTTMDVPLVIPGESKEARDRRMDRIALRQVTEKLRPNWIAQCWLAGSPPLKEGLLLLSRTSQAMLYRFLGFPQQRQSPAAIAIAGTVQPMEQELEVEVEKPLSAADMESSPPVDVGGVLSVYVDQDKVQKLAAALSRELRASGGNARAAAGSQPVRNLVQMLDATASLDLRVQAEAVIVTASRAIADAHTSAGGGWNAASGLGAPAHDAAARAAAAAASQGGAQAGGTGAETYAAERELVTHALEEKMQRHRSFVDFLRKTALWRPLTAARAAVLEHGERIAAAGALCGHQGFVASQSRFSQDAAVAAELLTNGIRAALQTRGWDPAELSRAGLSADDVYYRRLTSSADCEPGSVERQGDSGVLEALVQAVTHEELLPRVFRQLPAGGDYAALANYLNGAAKMVCDTLNSAEVYRRDAHATYCCGPRAYPWTQVGAARKLLFGLLNFYRQLLPRISSNNGSLSSFQEAGPLILQLSQLLLAGFAAERRGLAPQRFESFADAYETAKTAVFECLCACGSFDAAWALSYEHLYFNGLMQLCCRAKNGKNPGLQDVKTLLRVMASAESTSKGLLPDTRGRRLPFDEYAVDWLYSHKRFADLLTVGMWAQPALQKLLAKDRRGDGKLWAHLVESQEYPEAAQALWNEAHARKRVSLSQKRATLAMCKLCSIAAGSSGGAAAAAAAAPIATVELDAEMRLARAQVLYLGDGNDVEASSDPLEVVSRLMQRMAREATDSEPVASFALCAFTLLEDAAVAAEARASGERLARVVSLIDSIWFDLARRAAKNEVADLIRRGNGAAPNVSALPTDPEIEAALSGTLLHKVRAAVAMKGLRVSGDQQRLEAAIRELVGMPGAIGKPQAYFDVLLKCPNA